MDRTQARQIAADLRDAVAPVLAKHNLTGGSHRISYSDTDLKWSLPLVTEAKASAPIPSYVLRSVGLDDTVTRGTTFQSGGRTFTFTDVTLRRRTYPISATCDGKTYKFNTSVVSKINAAAKKEQ